MIYDLQKANMWKRISAFLFDGILLGILAVLFAWLLSMILRYDNWNNKLNDAYARYGEEYGVAFDISLSEYEALSPEEVEKLNAAYQAIGQDPEAVRAYNILIQLTLLITSFSLRASCLCLEFFIPMRLGSGRTLGKKIFGLGLMRTEGVKISNVSLFIRTILGKYAIEIMIPVLIVLMLYWGTIGIVGPIVLGLILIVQLVVMITTRTNSLIHDLLADTVVIDYASQMIFDSREEMIAFKEKAHREAVAHQTY